MADLYLCALNGGNKYRWESEKKSYLLWRASDRIYPVGDLNYGYEDSDIHDFVSCVQKMNSLQVGPYQKSIMSYYNLNNFFDYMYQQYLEKNPHIRSHFTLEAVMEGYAKMESYFHKHAREQQEKFANEARRKLGIDGWSADEELPLKHFLNKW